MAEGSSDLRDERKAWAQRNSDGRNTFEGEQSQPPPAFSLEEHELPASALRIDNPDEEGAAIRHVHVFGVDDPDA
jgi:hypothetical protein